MTGEHLPAGTIIGSKYRLEAPIGAGGFSHVYRAVHTSMDRPVALKVFDPEAGHQSDAVRKRRSARFVKEARHVSRLSHPNTVTIFDFGTEDSGLLYLVMELIEGSTLKEELRSGPLAVDRAVRFFLQILGSLAEAHHLGMLHRDLKPANVMVTENFKGQEIVKVLDFGIARMVSDPEVELSDRGKPLFLGTPRFAAPEQLTGGTLSFATDVFGAGALFWLCLTGRSMIATANLLECVKIAQDPTPFRLPDDHDLPPALVTLVERAVAKDPTERYQDASEMLRALEDTGLGFTRDLPEIKPSPFAVAREDIFDPNITDPDDEENLFLSTAAGRPPPVRQPPHKVSRRPAPEPDRPSPPRRRPAPTPLEIDETALRTSRTTPEPASERRRRRPTRPPLSLPDLSRRHLVLGVGAVLLVTLVAVVVLVPRDTAPPDVDEAQVPEVAQDPRSPFSVQGITTALRSTDWRFDGRRDPVELSRFTYHALVLRKGDFIVDVTLYDTDGSATIEELIASFEYPARSIVLGHIAVRINSRDTDPDDLASELIDVLATYRDLVLDQVSPNEGEFP